ncbi:hypothetical protein [Azospirillum sp. B510]|uniref:hypothetical protein n=1 Tax=Azospirillum sp. (strain B510) TaxID=137722 RepID=UPI0011D060A0|nr:hypothetical protein [Azospirillum sp. B510]
MPFVGFAAETADAALMMDPLQVCTAKDSKARANGESPVVAGEIFDLADFLHRTQNPWREKFLYNEINGQSHISYSRYHLETEIMVKGGLFPPVRR